MLSGLWMYFRNMSIRKGMGGMKMFTMKFDTGNAAFADEDMNFEVARILKKVTEQVEEGKTSGSIIDICGNKVGSWEIKE
jgi:hypothetical protein